MTFVYFYIDQNNDTERALDWLFSHPDDQGEDVNTNQDTSEKVIGDSNPPFDYTVKSFVSHKGTSIHCGHYVAHVKKGDEWVLFNDNRVAVTPNPPISEGYLYFLQRKH